MQQAELLWKAVQDGFKLEGAIPIRLLAPSVMRSMSDLGHKVIDQKHGDM